MPTYLHVYSNWYRLCFSALTLLVGWQEGHPTGKKLKWWGAGIVICLEQGTDLHMSQLMPLPLTGSCFSKIQTGFTFLVPEKGPLNGCVCVCVCVRVCMCLSVHDHIFGFTRPIFTTFLCVLPMAVARSSSGSVMICYVLPVLRITNVIFAHKPRLTSPLS